MKYDHRTACRIHAVKRAWERFGLALHIKDVQDLERKIWQGKAVWLEDQANMDSLYAMTVRGREMVVVFNITLDCIKTFLPRRDRAYQRWMDRRRKA